MVVASVQPSATQSSVATAPPPDCTHLPGPPNAGDGAEKLVADLVQLAACGASPDAHVRALVALGDQALTAIAAAFASRRNDDGGGAIPKPVYSVVVGVDSRLAGRVFLDLAASDPDGGRSTGGPRGKLAIEELVAQAASHPEERRRLLALEVLRWTGDWRALRTALLRGQEDPAPMNAALSVLFFGNRKIEGACARLVGLLTQPSIETRAAAIQALGILGDAGAAPYLLDVLDAPDELTRDLLVDAPSGSLRGLAVQAIEMFARRLSFDHYISQEGEARAWVAAHPVAATTCPRHPRRR